MKAISIITLVLTTVISGSAIAAGPVQHAAHVQHDRIAQGVHSGSLTKAEAGALIKQQNHIKSTVRAAGADHKVTPREANTIKHMQHNANVAIYKLKHN